MSRKDKKSIRKRTAEASRLDNFNDIGDIGEFEALSELSKGFAGDNSNDGFDFGDGDGTEIARNGKKGLGSARSIDPATALERAVKAFQSQNGGAVGGSVRKGGYDDALTPAYDKKSMKNGNLSKSKPSLADMDDDGYDDDEAMFETGKSRSKKSSKRASALDDDGDNDYDGGDFEQEGGKGDRKRRRAPDGPMGGFDGEDGGDEESSLLEEFAKAKKAYVNKKKEHYAAEPRYGGLEESLPTSGKRAASYEIMKNRGLTPHRKKENRNPRVKKRMAYEKAIVRRKGQVREVIAGAAATYAGELTGIKANISRSRKIGN